MLKTCLFILGIVAVLRVNADDWEKEDGVLVLTKDNFQKALDTHNFIMVEFYAPWCGHCRSLAPEYAKAAQTLKEEGSEIAMAKVDATVESELAAENGVRGYPTIKFFRHGKPIDYAAGRLAADMVAWMKKKSGPPAQTLETAEDAKSFIEKNEVVVIGYFKDLESSPAKAFMEAAGSTEDYPFAITNVQAIASEHSIAEDGISLFKKFDEGKAMFEGEVSADAVAKFVQANALPLVVEFNHETAQKVFGGEVKSHVLIFVGKSEKQYEIMLEAGKSLAKPLRDRILFVHIDTDEEEHKRILEFFGMKESDIPDIRIIKLEEDMTKYKPAKVVADKAAMEAFVNDFLDGKLKPHLLSEDLPEDWDKKPVKTLVSSNFDEVAFDKDKDVLVEFYAPWCGHCKQLAPIYDQLGEKYESNDKIVIAKMDATANELEHTKIQSFPTIKLYRKGDNKIVEYNGERTLEGLSKFLDTDGVYGQAAPDSMPEEEEKEEEEDTPSKDEL
jgi:protein disulfide-isomerase A1